MQDLFISLNNNKLKISTVDPKTGFKSVVEELTGNTVDGSAIVDSMTFSGILAETITKVTPQAKNKLLLNFLIEPQDTILLNFTLRKGSNGDEEQIVSEIKRKLEDVDLNDLYFSYQKIAPFLYQFVGIRKNILENLIDVSNTVKIGLKSVIPWILLLPKYVETVEPSVFLVKREGGEAIAFSELGGVSFSGVFEGGKSSKELKEVLNKITFYKKVDPLKNVYTLNYDSDGLSDFNTVKIDLPVAEIDSDGAAGFEINILANFMLDKDPTLVSGITNLLNLLPLPAIVKKPSVMVYVGSTLLGVGLIGSLVFFGILKRPHADTGNLAQNINANQETVLSSETSSSGNSMIQPESTPAELKKSDLKIRVENGTGISGIAAKTRDLLNSLGYNVVSIDTADQERKDTLLKFAAGKAGFKTLITEDSKDKFGDIVIEDGLASGLDYDLLIVVGGDVNL